MNYNRVPLLKKIKKNGRLQRTAHTFSSSPHPLKGLTETRSHIGKARVPSPETREKQTSLLPPSSY